MCACRGPALWEDSCGSSCLIHTVLQLSVQPRGGVAAVRVLIVATHDRLGWAAAICGGVRKSQVCRCMGRIQGQGWASPRDREWGLRAASA